MKKTLKKERNYGIDLLRIISMTMVVVLHCFKKGGLLNNPALTSSQYNFVWFFEILCYCAVNIFAIISGYVGYKEKEEKQKISNYLNLWVQIVFYGLLVSLVFNFYKPEVVTSDMVIKMLFPVTAQLYWYFTAYTGLFFLIPYLNKIIRNSSEKELKRLIFIIIIVFSVIGNTFRLFQLEGGYTVIWLALLYLIGASMKKMDFGKKLKVWQCFLGIFVLTTVSFIYKLFGPEFMFITTKFNKNLFINYCSITIVMNAILFVIAFSKIKFNNVINKIIAFLAPGAFTIYILNNNKFIWNYVIENHFASLAGHGTMLVAYRVALFTIIFVVGSLLIDKVRSYIFKFLRIDKLIKKVDRV